jgi:hypothetical protein
VPKDKQGLLEREGGGGERERERERTRTRERERERGSKIRRGKMNGHVLMRGNEQRG